MAPNSKHFFIILIRQLSLKFTLSLSQSITMSEIHVQFQVSGRVDDEDEAEEGRRDDGEVPVELRVRLGVAVSTAAHGDGGVDLPQEDHHRRQGLVGRQVLLPPQGGHGSFKGTKRVIILTTG